MLSESYAGYIFSVYVREEYIYRLRYYIPRVRRLAFVHYIIMIELTNWSLARKLGQFDITKFFERKKSQRHSVLLRNLVCLK